VIKFYTNEIKLYRWLKFHQSKCYFLTVKKYLTTDNDFAIKISDFRQNKFLENFIGKF